MLPPRFRWELAHSIEDWTWAFDMDVQTAIRSAPIQVGTEEFYSADREAVLNVRLGLKRNVNDLLSIGGGLFTDRSGLTN